MRYLSAAIVVAATCACDVVVHRPSLCYTEEEKLGWDITNGLAMLGFIVMIRRNKT